jgi:hypothetical protein
MASAVITTVGMAKADTRLGKLDNALLLGFDTDAESVVRVGVD